MDSQQKGKVMTDNVMAACQPDDPMLIAWRDHQETEEYRNSTTWALRRHAYGASPNGDRMPASEELRAQWVCGALWAAFMAGYRAATERAAGLHESVNPASDNERLNKVPGAGAMGAVIQYRDLIRARET